MNAAVAVLNVVACGFLLVAITIEIRAGDTVFVVLEFLVFALNAASAVLNARSAP